MKQWQILLFISFIYYICIEAEFPYLGGEGGSQGLTRKNRPCVLNSLSEDPLSASVVYTMNPVDHAKQDVIPLVSFSSHPHLFS